MENKIISKKETGIRQKRKTSAKKINVLPQVSLLPEPNSIKAKNLVYILTAFLIITCFLLGMAFIKIETLEQAKAAMQITSQITPIPTPKPNSSVRIDNGHLPGLGNKMAKVTIIEFGDFQCSFCKRFFDDTESQLKTDYINTGKVVFYYRQFPLSSHANAEKAAEASECANEQNNFWTYHDILFKNQDDWTNLSSQNALTIFIVYASQLGLDTTTFNSCLRTNKYTNNIKDDINNGMLVNSNAAPTFIINGHTVVGTQSYPEFQTLINEELNK